MFQLFHSRGVNVVIDACVFVNKTYRMVSGISHHCQHLLPLLLLTFGSVKISREAVYGEFVVV